jgi:hypothetical protein
MSVDIAALIRQLDDPAQRSQAEAGLLALGPAAVEPLLSALEQAEERLLRTTLHRLLLQIADPRAREAFLQGLKSSVEDVRASAAVGLYRLGDPQALQAALATIDDAPDPLHADDTPSVRTLVEMDVAALPTVLPLLNAERPDTRQHAQKVLAEISYRMVARQSGAQEPRPLAAWQALWVEMGSYQWYNPEPERLAAIARWRAWLAQLVSTYK